MEKRCRFSQLFFRNVDRDVDGRFYERLDENPSLGAGAGAQSDELDILPEVRGDLGAISIENVDLGRGDIVFWEFANSLEQRRATLVVKIFTRKRTRIAGKTGDDVREEIRRCRRNLRSRLYGRYRTSGHYGILVRRVRRPRPADLLWITREPDPCKLPAFFRL